MKISASAVSLNVADPEASGAFLVEHFGFEQAMAADGFVSLAREDVGMSVVFLRTGLESEGVAITMPLTVEPWGERAFQVRDPNRVIVQLVDWEG